MGVKRLQSLNMTLFQAPMSAHVWTTLHYADAISFLLWSWTAGNFSVLYITVAETS